MKKLVEKIKLFSVVFPSFLRSRHRSKLALTLYSTYLPIENTFLVSHTKQVKAVKASCQIHWFMGEEAGVKPLFILRTPIWNRRVCSSKMLNLTPKGDHLGVAYANFDP